MATRIEQVSEDALRLNQWTLYPAMVRLQQQGWIKGAWRKTENNREAKYYAITKAGQKALVEETQRWRRMAGLVDKLLCEQRGFHHHATLCIAAYGFLVAERNRFSSSARAGHVGLSAPEPPPNFRPRGSPRSPRAA